MNEKTIKPLSNKSVEGLSEKQLIEHHDVLYAGYVKKLNEIRTKLSSVKLEDANATFSDLRELKVEETFALNAIKLHEGYFDVLGNNGELSQVGNWIAEDFGSVERWAVEFSALGLCARGWVVLAMDLEDGKLYNFVSDSHNQGGIWGCVPLLILDVYEHAYFLDYATGRKKYIESFMKQLNWEHVNNELKKYDLARLRK